MTTQRWKCSMFFTLTWRTRKSPASRRNNLRRLWSGMFTGDQTQEQAIFSLFLFLPSAHVCTGNKRNNVTQQWTQCFILQRTFRMYLLSHVCYNWLHLGYNKQITVQTWTKITFPNTHRTQHNKRRIAQKGAPQYFPILSLFSRRQGGGGGVGRYLG